MGIFLLRENTLLLFRQGCLNGFLNKEREWKGEGF